MGRFELSEYYKQNDHWRIPCNDLIENKQPLTIDDALKIHNEYERSFALACLATGYLELYSDIKITTLQKKENTNAIRRQTCVIDFLVINTRFPTTDPHKRRGKLVEVTRTPSSTLLELKDGERCDPRKIRIEIRKNKQLSAINRHATGGVILNGDLMKNVLESSLFVKTPA